LIGTRLAAGDGMRAGAWRAPCAVFLLVLVNYLLSAPRGVMLDDDGYFILAAYFGGVAHPPGYPLYTLIAGLFSHLPFGPVAFRVHACSAVFGALACAVLWSFLRRLTQSRTAAWIGALAYALSGMFWSQATVAEVYSLHALLFLLLLQLCAIPGGNATRGYWVAGLGGLSLANHWPLMFVSAPALAAAAWPQRRALSVRPLRVALAFMLGLLPYAWMVYRSRVSEIAFFGPIGTFSDFWFYVSREAYADIDTSAAAGWVDKLRYAGFSLFDTARQFGWVGAAFAVVGLVAQWRAWPRSLCWALVLAFAGNTVGLAMLLGFDWDLMHRNVFAPYPLVAHGIAAMWLALGVTAVAKWLARRLPESARLQVLLPALAAMAVVSVWLQNAPASYRSGSNWAGEFAATLLESLKPDSVLFVAGDYAVGPVAYLNRIEGVRPDVEVFNVTGQLFRNRLVSPRNSDPRAVRVAMERFIAGERRPIFYFPDMPHRQAVIQHGLVYEISRTLPAGANQVILTPRIEAFFARMFARADPANPSELMHRRQLESTYCRALAALVRAQAPAGDPRRLESNCSGFYALLERADLLITGDGKDAEQALTLLRRAAGQVKEAVSIPGIATLDNLYGLAYDRLGATGPALEHLQRSVARWPDAANPAHALLAAHRSR
jgi:hypothetical protein